MNGYDSGNNSYYLLNLGSVSAANHQFTGTIGCNDQGWGYGVVSLFLATENYSSGQVPLSTPLAGTFTDIIALFSPMPSAQVINGSGNPDLIVALRDSGTSTLYSVNTNVTVNQSKYLYAIISQGIMSGSMTFNQ